MVSTNTSFITVLLKHITNPSTDQSIIPSSREPWVSKLALQTLCEVMSFQEKGQGLSQQDSLFSNSSRSFESPLYFLTQALLFGG
ncbi:hypothetical protein DAPPUDRAFT_316310 [Daphnia pulex]|uniref:Uncharacterized protein n=1 Tax=Daphnia pulex TaxID=6669 RepID=E9GCH6_DAPPU|nr:hypothetical protein DAPPUDRAFT_316309 [Daphnia pulex]EFX82866.1 hypothetical protein DAPPUDRAFT_316310 [Daphnia pulex]|eukprot:EFX82562.1 hypothetical protein DAPPUDRAFT_316309 [Daphnia pulex]